jgi:hypothetical protein
MFWHYKFVFDKQIMVLANFDEKLTWLIFDIIAQFNSLQDFTVLQTDQFRQCVIRSSSVIFLPTSSPTDYVRRLSLRRWFPLPSLYRSEKQKNHLPMVLQTEFARQKKKDSRLKYTDGFLFRRWYCNWPTKPICR